MKRTLRVLWVCIFALILSAVLVSCASNMPEYSITMPDGYSRSFVLSGDGSDVYDMGIFADNSNMVTVTYYSPEELTDENGQRMERDAFVETYFAAFFAFTGGAGYTEVTMGGYTLYEYKDMMESTGAMYVYDDGESVWTIDFSIEDADYADFKDEIPKVIESFMAK